MPRRRASSAATSSTCCAGLSALKKTPSASTICSCPSLVPSSRRLLRATRPAMSGRVHESAAAPAPKPAVVDDDAAAAAAAAVAVAAPTSGPSAASKAMGCSS